MKTSFKILNLVTNEKVFKGLNHWCCITTQTNSPLRFSPAGSLFKTGSQGKVIIGHVCKALEKLGEKTKTKLFF